MDLLTQARIPGAFGPAPEQAPMQSDVPEEFERIAVDLRERVRGGTGAPCDKHHYWEINMDRGRRVHVCVQAIYAQLADRGYLLTCLAGWGWHFETADQSRGRNLISVGFPDPVVATDELCGVLAALGEEDLRRAILAGSTSQVVALGGTVSFSPTLPPDRFEKAPDLGEFFQNLLGRMR